MLFGAESVVADTPVEWTRIAELSFPLALEATVTAAELEACLFGVLDWLVRGRILFFLQ